MSRLLRLGFSRRPTLRTSLFVTATTALGVSAYTVLRTRSAPDDDLPADASSLYYGRRPLQLDSTPFVPSSSDGHGRPSSTWTPPTRGEMLEALQSADPHRGDGARGFWSKAAGSVGLGKWVVEEVVPESAVQEFDLLIVGGGATGAGVALDAASRGLKVALVERDDFSSGEISSLQHKSV